MRIIYLPELVLVLSLISCTSGIKNYLDYSIGGERVKHERVFFGPSINSETIDHGMVYIYELNNRLCKYEITVNDEDMITGYKFLSDRDVCEVPVNWGGSW